LLVYLLSKIVIEKNAQSISMVKILGYQGAEIARLYVVATAIVAIASMLVSIPLSYLTIKWLYFEIIKDFSGWLNYYVSPSVYVKMVVYGVVAYLVIGALQLTRVRKIPMGEALKDSE
ncbi:MAG: ABC transporter permease, partial [Oscillospiraceae bacterium]|nr:ABC transporter permease [Oscillospiraceae bacterium]